MPNNTVHNIILFGETGAGKSSLVNMIMGTHTARVSGDADGCTFRSEPHNTLINDTFFVVHDTAGLNEGDQGRVPHWKAIRELYTLIRRLDGVSLLIYCMRGRIKENAHANWNLFDKVVCGGKVPIIAVVTGLETFEDPNDWWKKEANKNALKANGMRPKDVGCVVSYQGREDEFASVYAKSQGKVRDLIMANHLRKPWREEKDKWFANIYSESFSMSCFAARSRLDYTETMQVMIDELIKQTDMKEGDAKKLRETLLKAEKKFRKGLSRRY